MRFMSSLHVQRRPSLPPRRLSSPDEHWKNIFAFLCPFGVRYPCPLSDCHTLPDSANGCVTDSKILCSFVSARMRFLSVLHALNVYCVRSYLLASFGHVQNFARTPPDKYARWMNVTGPVVCCFSVLMRFVWFSCIQHPVGILYVLVDV